jgi:hypothetical protein
VRDISFPISRIREPTFFEQAQLQRLLGDDVFQGGDFPASIPYLVRGLGPGGITCGAALAGFEELFWTRRRKRLCALPSLWHSSAMMSSPRRPSSTILILPSAEK